MKLYDFCVAMAVSIAITASGATYRISAPNGVGDAGALECQHRLGFVIEVK